MPAQPAEDLGSKRYKRTMTYKSVERTSNTNLASKTQSKLTTEEKELLSIVIPKYNEVNKQLH